MDCEAPCANEGGKENKASPIKNIFFLLIISNFSFTKIGKALIFSKFFAKSKNEFLLIDSRIDFKKSLLSFTLHSIIDLSSINSCNLIFAITPHR